MNITPNLIAVQQIAGSSKEGKPVLYVLSKGGLHAFFTKDTNGTVVTLGTAPHRAIAMWMAEKRDPGLKWDADFKKSEVDYDSLHKSEAETFVKLHTLFFYPVEGADLIKGEPKDEYFVYDTRTKVIGVMDSETVSESIKKGEIDRFCLIRPTDLSEPPSVMEFHPRYFSFFREKV